MSAAVTEETAEEIFRGGFDSSYQYHPVTDGKGNWTEQAKHIKSHGRDFRDIFENCVPMTTIGNMQKYTKTPAEAYLMSTSTVLGRLDAYIATQPKEADYPTIKAVIEAVQQQITTSLTQMEAIAKAYGLRQVRKFKDPINKSTARTFYKGVALLEYALSEVFDSASAAGSTSCLKRSGGREESSGHQRAGQTGQGRREG